MIMFKTEAWPFWALLAIVLGIGAGITGDMGLHNTQVAFGLSTAASAAVAAFRMLGKYL
jgi:uncharacterized membrane protein YedE/YeeE